MKKLSQELLELIERFKTDFLNIEESVASIKISEDKWTLKEIIGHLIDSASNNHQRFVRLKISNELTFPDYKTEKWLKAQPHNNMQFSDLMHLFYFYNMLLANIIKDFDECALKNKWNVKWNENSEFITLEDLANHYVIHLKGHFEHMTERVNEIKQFQRRF